VCRARVSCLVPFSSWCPDHARQLAPGLMPRSFFLLLKPVCGTWPCAQHSAPPDWSAQLQQTPPGCWLRFSVRARSVFGLPLIHVPVSSCIPSCPNATFGPWILPTGAQRHLILADSAVLVCLSCSAHLLRFALARLASSPVKAAHASEPLSICFCAEDFSGNPDSDNCYQSFLRGFFPGVRFQSLPFKPPVSELLLSAAVVTALPLKI
jgi:hypothetical protein